MKTLKQSIICFLFFVSSLNNAWAQDKEQAVQFQKDVSGVGTSAATFLEIGVGGRAMGMGGAYTAVANDATALYWNPAGIVWVSNMQAEVMHTEWLADTNYDFFGLVVPIPSLYSSIGFSVISLDYGSQIVRTVERPEGTGETFDARDIAVGLSYAMALTDRFSFGLGGKYVSQRIWSESGSAFAADLGVFYNTQLKGLRLGASMSNFGTEIKLHGRRLRTTVDPDKKVDNFDRVPVDYRTGTYPLPLLFRFAISYESDWGKLGNVLLAMDINHPSNATESICMGLEYGMAGIFYLRGGYENMFERDGINGLTLGGGIDYSMPGEMGIRIDYAWSDWGIFNSAQRFSVGVIF